MMLTSDSDEYVSECNFIEITILKVFNQHANGDAQGKLVDGSVNVLQIYYDVFACLEKAGRPRAKWLRWKTQLGWLLFGMLLATKLKRWIREQRAEVVGSEGWKGFEVAWGNLQAKILESVRSGGES